MRFITLSLCESGGGDVVLLAQNIVCVREKHEPGQTAHTSVEYVIGDTGRSINVLETAMEVKKLLDGDDHTGN